MTLDENALTTANQSLRYLHKILENYDRVTGSNEFKGVFILSSIHGAPYFGPFFDTELIAEARTFLAAHADYLETFQGPT
jgi:hypothetical protein